MTDDFRDRLSDQSSQARLDKLKRNARLNGLQLGRVTGQELSPGGIASDRPVEVRGGAIGREVDAWHRTVRGRKRKRLTKTANIKIFFEQYDAQNQLRYWVGGDREAPDQIPWTLPNGEIIENGPSYWVFGPGLNDWGFTVKTKVGNAPKQVGTVFKIYTIYGDGRSFVAESPKLWLATYYGAGCWLENNIKFELPWRRVDAITDSTSNPAPQIPVYTYDVPDYNSGIEVCVGGGTSNSCVLIPRGVTKNPRFGGTNSKVTSTTSTQNGIILSPGDPALLNTQPVMNFNFSYSGSLVETSSDSFNWTVVPYSEGPIGAWGNGSCPPQSPPRPRSYVNHGGVIESSGSSSIRGTDNFSRFSVYSKDGAISEQSGQQVITLTRDATFFNRDNTGVLEAVWGDTCVQIEYGPNNIESGYLPTQFTATYYNGGTINQNTDTGAISRDEVNVPVYLGPGRTGNIVDIYEADISFGQPIVRVNEEDYSDCYYIYQDDVYIYTRRVNTNINQYFLVDSGTENQIGSTFLPGTYANKKIYRPIYDENQTDFYSFGELQIDVNSYSGTQETTEGSYFAIPEADTEIVDVLFYPET